MSAVDERIDATQCGGKENCRADDKCLTHDVWIGLNRQISNYLEGISLGTLVDAKHSGIEEVVAKEKTELYPSNTIKFQSRRQ